MQFILSDWEFHQEEALSSRKSFRTLPEVLFSAHLWPSGDFLQHNNTIIGVAHQNHYEAHIFQGDDILSVKRMATSGFKNVGGGEHRYHV